MSKVKFNIEVMAYHDGSYLYRIVNRATDDKGERLSREFQFTVFKVNTDTGLQIGWNLPNIISAMCFVISEMTSNSHPI